MVYRNRREFLKQSACGAAAFGLAGHGLLSAAPEEKRRPRIAAIYTELREFSHAYHILEPHMGPYLFNGKLTDPGVDVVSFYCDQYPENDMTREASARLNMPMYDTIAEALTCGGDMLAVDGVLLIGEHGNYPKNELGQVMYPRKEFFDQIVAVFRRTGRSVPVFNDKHLSYRWDWAKEMYDTAQEMGFPLMAGSSVPLAPRVPAVEFPTGAEVVEAVSIHGGGMESYDFHALEVMQSMIEFRK
ncbi:MAG: twin-arginine translocation signal domain-containing protein, partial [Maioricimonas sp. JB045]